MEIIHGPRQKIKGGIITKTGTLSLIVDIMDAITDSQEWSRRQTKDPIIIDAEKRQSQALERAKAYLPIEIFNELDDANTRISSAYGDAGIMYGLYIAANIADLLKEIGANPFALSEIYLERMKGGA